MTPAPSSHARVFELEESGIEESNVDGAQVCERDLGVYGSLAKAMAAHRRDRAAGSGPGAAEIVYYTISERPVDAAESRYGRTWVFQNGRLCGRVEAWSEDPARGWRPSRCHFKPRDVVGFALGDTWHLGVVIEPPVDPECARRLEAVAWEEGVYLIGTPCQPGECAHEHIHESLLFVPRGRIAPDLRAALIGRFRQSNPRPRCR